jgi:hypothetical protein
MLVSTAIYRCIHTITVQMAAPVQESMGTPAGMSNTVAARGLRHQVSSDTDTDGSTSAGNNGYSRWHGRWNVGVVGFSLTRGMDVRVRLFCFAECM